MADRRATSTTTSTTSGSATGSVPHRGRAASSRPATAGRSRSARRRVATATTPVLVANGHHWDPQLARAAVPGPGRFTGEQLHSHYYREPDERFVDRNVLVLGIGNSATRHRGRDLARLRGDLPRDAPRRARHAQVHRSACPLDQPRRARPWRGCRSRLTAAAACAMLTSRPGHDGPTTACPSPTTRCCRPTRRSPPTCSTGSATATSRSSPNIERFDGVEVFVRRRHRRARSTRSSTAPATRSRFPFLDDALVGTADNHVDLYRRVVRPRPPRALLHRPGPAARRDHAARRGASPSGSPTCSRAGPRCRPREACAGRSSARTSALRKRYVASKRHTIQVDFHAYMRTLARERKRRRGVKRPLPAAARPPRGGDPG